MEYPSKFHAAEVLTEATTLLTKIQVYVNKISVQTTFPK
jgi:hypothetical protein